MKPKHVQDRHDSMASLVWAVVPSTESDTGPARAYALHNKVSEGALCY